jgi:hypothetical protein
VTAEAPFIRIPGRTPLVLIAPHGGRRDPVRRPWADGRLKVNDLYTAELTVELAARTGAAALINGAGDRNDVDLNRVSEANDAAPGFLEALAELLDATLARHGHATLLTVHGWNVIQPCVDVGLGCSPGDDPFAVGRAAAVSPGFAATGVRALVSACAAHGIAATVGARYPARHRENLLQLFTARYREDTRPLVRRLAALAPRVEAVQLELGIALRWPGPWRQRLLAACDAALPEIVVAAGDGARPAAAAPAPPAAAPRDLTRRFEFTSPTLCGLVALDGVGGRLLLFPPEGGLVLFTGERTGPAPSGRVGALAFDPLGAGHRVTLRGPLLRFPETTPFLDLEAGLATAALVDADVELEFTPDAGAGGFGRVSGRVVLDGARVLVDGHGFTEDGAPGGPWPRLRVALRLGESGRLVLTVALDGTGATGVLYRDGTELPVAVARAELGPPHSPLERFALEVELASGERLRLTPSASHRLPVVRLRGPTALRLEFAACRLEDGAWPAGWCEVGL